MDIRDLLKETKVDMLRAAARHGARNVRIFGSVVRGQADAESDMDILVDLEPGRTLFDLGGLWWELNELLLAKVDVVMEKGLKRRIKERVLKEAVPL